MDQNLGVEWFQNVFLKECEPDRPQLLTVDSHCSYEPIDLLELAEKEKLCCLFPAIVPIPFNSGTSQCFLP